MRSQDATADTVAATSKGCVWNQRVGDLVAGAGLAVTSSHRHLGGLFTTLVAVKPGRGAGVVTAT